MPQEIPTQFSFEELLAHTFPGFFSVLCVFMLLDVLCPYDLTSWAFRTFTNFLSAMVSIIIFGTALGVIIDGLHHLLIEPKIFERMPKYKEVHKREIQLCPPGCIYSYYFTRIGKDAFDYAERYYAYSEFYTNTCISLILFSLISPFYFCYILKIYWVWSITVGLVVPLSLAYICIGSGYLYFYLYYSFRNDMFLGFLDSSHYIEISAEPDHICANGLVYSTITAQLKEWKSKKNVLQKVKITFEATKGDLSTQYGTKEGSVLITETQNNGEIQVYLSSREPGIAIITAFSENFLTGNVQILLEKKYRESTQ
jgi:hypothetical protein